MQEFNIVGTTNCIEDENVELELTVKALDGNPFVLHEDTDIELHNLYTLIDAVESEKQLTFLTEKTKKTVDFIFNNDDNIFYVSNDKQIEVIGLKIQIRGKRISSFTDKTELVVVFTLENTEKKKEENKLSFTVYKKKESVQIVQFTSNVAILHKGVDDLEFSYQLEGNPEEVVLFENGKKIQAPRLNTIKLTADEPEKVSCAIPDTVPFGWNEYTLEIKKGTQVVSETISVLYVDNGGVFSRNSISSKHTILNFCVAQNGDYLFALMVDDSKKITLQATEQIGGTATWFEIQVSNPELLKPFVNSPMIQLQSTNEITSGSLGRILFIGGSRISTSLEYKEFGAKMVQVELKLDKKNSVIQKETNLKKGLWGHTVVLFPKDKNANTLWLFGGQFEYGDLNTEIHTSTDGITWEVVKMKGEIWKPRSLMSVTAVQVSEDGELKQPILYLGGGFDGFGGTSFNDLWYSDEWGTTWTEFIQNEDKKLPEKIMSFGIGFGGFEDEISSTGIVLLGKATEPFSYQILKDNNQTYFSADTSKWTYNNVYNQGVVLTVFFKGCLWFMHCNDNGEAGVTYSKLYYRVPQIHSKTLKI